jgi:hypothetical protein
MHTGTPWQLFLALCATSCFLENPAALDVRVVDWNPSGSDWNLNNDIPVAETVIELVDYMDAQIVTLQEVTLPSLEHLEASLPGWTCERELFGVDYIAVCTDGPFTSVQEAEPTLESACDVKPICCDADPEYGKWAGYVQVDYGGMLVTSIHTANCADDEHIAELYREVTTGIVAGDFNHESPDVAGWTQTDEGLEWTWGWNTTEQVKIDHVFAIEATDDVYGDAWNDKEGSNHRPVLAGITFAPIFGPAP